MRTYKKVELDKRTLKGLTSKQKKFLTVYFANFPALNQSAIMAGTTRQTHYNWLKDSELYREKFEMIQDMKLDNIEAAAYKLAGEDNDKDMIKFVLQKHGRKRGWGDTLEIGNIEGQSLSITVEKTIIVRKEHDAG